MTKKLPEKKKRFDISITKSSKDRYFSGVTDNFRDGWEPQRSINVGGHAGVRETERMFEQVEDGDHD